MESQGESKNRNEETPLLEQEQDQQQHEEEERNGGATTSSSPPASYGLSSSNSSNKKKSKTARSTYVNNDADGSRRYHDNIVRTNRKGNDIGTRQSSSSSSEDAHQDEGGMLKIIIFGGLDGMLTSFALVAGCAGGNLSSKVVMILGCSKLLAGAFSMGIGEFISSKANNEWILSEKQREIWELDNYPEGEVSEMIDLYTSKGISIEDATIMISTMSKYKDFFVDIMMIEELQLQVPDDDYMKQSIKEGIIMFTSFAFFGLMPLLGYIMIPTLFPTWNSNTLFVSACIVTAITLFLLGSVKSFVSCQHWFYAGMETLLLGGLCATVAYTVGELVGDWATTTTIT